MTYRGKMEHGVVVLEGEKPADGTLVDVTPATGVAESVAAVEAAGSIMAHPAMGIWRGRSDLPEDPAEASAVLRERLMRRADERE